MKGFLKNRWFLLLVLLVFVLLKIPHLHYPYYWDESWPYASAVRAMHDAGPGLSPSAIDPELSRGHPLFFHFMAACWMKVFGPSLVSMHSFALFIALSCLVVLYESMLRMYGPVAAAVAVVFIASREAFFVHSSFVLPEVLVGVLALLALWSYTSRRYMLAGAALSALFLTKEPGLVVGLVLGIDALIAACSRDGHTRERMLRIAAVCVPVLPVAIFFLVQYKLRGWFVFPLHIAELNFDWNTTWYKFRTAPLTDVFVGNHVHVVYLAAALLGVAGFLRTRKWHFLAMAPVVILIYYMVDDTRCGRLMPGPVFVTVFLVAWAVATWYGRMLFDATAARKFFVLSMSVILCFLVFSSFNFYTARYVIVAIVMSSVVLGALGDACLRVTHAVLAPLFILLIAGVGIWSYSVSNNEGDTGRLSFAAMDAQKSVVEYLMQEEAYDKNITAFSFMHRKHLTDSATGYLMEGRIFTHVEWDFSGNSDYVVFDNIDPDYRYGEIISDKSMVRVHRFAERGIWSEVYRRRR